MPMRKNHHQLYLYQQKQTVPSQGIWLTFYLQLRPTEKERRVLSVQHRQHLTLITSVWSDLTNILGVANIWWNTQSSEKVSAGISGHLHQPNASQQQDGLPALPLHVSRALWMLPQRQAGSHISQEKGAPRDNQTQIFLESEFKGKANTLMNKL